MQRRALGKSGIDVPVVVLGAWAYGGWYWGPANDEEAVQAVHAALDAGMTAIDTAPVYGLGKSEEVVGRALAGRRAEAQILTKCGLRWDSDEGEFDFDLVMPDGGKYPLYRNLRPASVRRECEDSLRRLGTDYIDLLQCHWPDPSTPIADTMGELAKLHAEGKIRAVGVSNYSPEQMEEARAALGDVPLASDQPKYNLLFRNIERDVLPYAREQGIGIIVYSPLEQGLLTGRVDEERTFARGDMRARLWKFSPPNRRLVNRAVEEHLKPVAGKYGATPAQVATAWVFHQPGVTAAIVGARTADQVRENARAGALSLENDEVSQIGKAFAALELQKKA